MQTRDFYEFDPAIKTWTQLTPFGGKGRSFATSFTLAGKGYVAGGYPADNDLWQFDPTTKRWVQKSSVPGALSTGLSSGFTIGDIAYLTHSAPDGTMDLLRYKIEATDTLKVIFAGKNFINLDWENFNTANAIVAYDVYVNGDKKYTTPESAITADKLLPGTSYTFTVVGRDSTGNSTPMSSPVTATTTSTVDGLNYRYFEGTWDMLPNFNTLTAVKSALSPNVDINTRNTGINDHFGFVWEATLTIPTPGNYTFETVSDDGSRFYFNSFYNPSVAPLINNDGIHNTVIPVTGTVNVPLAGQYPVALSFFNKQGGASMQLYWTGPPGSGITRQLVPDAAFSGNYNPLTDAPSSPANLKALTVARNFVNLQWDVSTDNTGVAFYDVYLNGIKRASTGATQLIIDSLTENTNYIFTVKASDVAGNSSAFSIPLTITTINVINGLTYRYYEGNWDALPDFNSLTPVKTGTSPNVDISLRSANVNDHFGFVWEGVINIPYPGTYTFETLSDDGSKIYFNSFYSLTSNAFVNNDGVHGAFTPVTGTLNIAAAGQYPITITYFEKDSQQSLQLYWTGPAGSGIRRQLIPDAAFTGNYLQPADTLPPTVPVNLTTESSSRNSVALDWDDASDNKGVAFYDVYIGGELKYSTTLSEVIADSLDENTIYTFMVKAKDLAGNTSMFSTVLSFTTSEITNGLSYRYYEGDWNTLPDFTSLKHVKKSLSPNVDINKRNQGVNDRFGFLWEGNVNIITPGMYTFETVSDDGSKLYFNSRYSASATPLINNDGLHGPSTPVTATINITAARRYPISIAYFEKDGGESMQVYWTGPTGSGINRQLIPDAAFKGNQFNVADLIAPSAPNNLKVLFTGRNKISLDWDNSTDNVGVAYYDVYVNGSIKYTTAISELIVDSLLQATTYNFAVRARDVAGNISGFSPQVTGTTTRNDNGLSYRYYEGTWDNLPDFNAMTPVKKGLSSNVNINLRPTVVNDHFGFVWEGLINIPIPGMYTFEIVSDDGSKLYFNSTYSASAIPLVNNDGIHGAYDTAAGSVNVSSAGLYPFALTFFEKDGGESMKVYWTGPLNSGIKRALIPDAAFTANYIVAYDTIPPSSPVNFAVTGINPTALKLSWGNINASADVLKYDIYINGEKKYSTAATKFIVDSLLPNTLYTLKAKATDSAGNSSPFSNDVTARTLFTTDGLDYKYYEGSWDKLPDFSGLIPVLQGTSPAIDLGIRPAGRNDNFAIVWDGYIKVPVQGTYYFEIISDDGSKLSFNNVNIINNDGPHAARSATGNGEVNAAEAYPISISYFEKDGDEKLEVYWTGPGMPRQLIPKAAFVRYVPSISFVEGNVAVKGLGINVDAAINNSEAMVKMYPNPFHERYW